MRLMAANLGTGAVALLPWLHARMADVKAGKGPILAVLSGSNIREISFQLFDDEDTLTLTKAA